MDTSRGHWKDDEEFVKFNDKMLKELFTFGEILDLSTFKDIEFTSEIDWSEVENEWTAFVKDWNEVRNVECDGDELKCLGFVGLTYLMTVFPYDKIKNPSIFCQHEAEMFNIITFYNKQTYLPFEDMPELFDSGPISPPAYQQWIDHKYNSASWWVTYIVYERRKGLDHIYEPDKKVVKN